MLGLFFKYFNELVLFVLFSGPTPLWTEYGSRCGVKLMIEKDSHASTRAKNTVMLAKANKR